MRPAVFLDRDGTLIEEVGYLDRLERLSLFPWTVDAVRLLNRAGLPVVVVSNQAGVARGFFDENFVHELHRHLDERLAAGGARIDRYYFCPHHPDAPVQKYRVNCQCRKPGAGMVRQAADELDLEPATSFVIGDRWLDVELAANVGATGVLVRTGYGLTEEDHPKQGLRPALVADNLIDAVGWILRQRASDGVTEPSS